jgi:two-component sensor histidine kinase
MALVHTQLYQSESLSDIELGNYLENLSSLVVSTYDISGGPVSLRKSLDPVIVDVDTAVSVGLLTNEFLSNALKHAFPPGERGEIFLSLTQKGETLELLVRDTGKGLPEDFDIQRSHSLGLKLIEALVLQLKGSLEIRSGNGTEFLVTVAHETAG